MRRILRITGIVLLALIAVAGIALIVALRSGFLHEKVRVAIESGIGGAIDGKITIGEVRGGLLGDATLIDIRIVGSDGDPFLSIDTLRGNYALPMILRRDYIFSNVRVVRPVVFLEQRTGEPWNYARIFRLKSDTAKDPAQAPKMRVALNDAELVDGTVNLRAPWRVDSTLASADSARAVAAALSDSNIFRVERAGSTYQMVQKYSGLSAFLPRVRIISADESPMHFEIDRLAVLALITQRYPLDVRDAKGVLEVARDSVRFTETRLQLPHSFVRGDGSYRFDGVLTATTHADSLLVEDIRGFAPQIPPVVRAAFELSMRRSPEDATYDFSQLVAHHGRATVTGDLELSTGQNNFADAAFNAQLRVASLSTNILREYAPAVMPGMNGTFSGSVNASGRTNDGRIQSDLVYDDNLSGRSSGAINGAFVWTNELRLRDMAVRLDAVQLALMKHAAPDFPLAGVVTGNATLNGVVGDSLASVVDLSLTSDGRQSHVAGKAAMLAARTANPVFQADLKADPIDITLLNPFLPPDAAVLRGVASGDLTASGPMSSMRVGLDLVVEGGGSVAAEGTVGLAGANTTYDLNVRTEGLNLASFIQGAETSSLTGSSTVRGRGVALDSLTASAAVELRKSSYRDIVLDSSRVGARIDRGVIQVDSLGAFASGVVARASGSFGLTDRTTGSLDYRISVDSLATIAHWIPGLGDSTRIAPRPARIVEAYRIAREDSARIARQTAVEREIRGLPPPGLNVQVPPPIPMDSVSGRAYATGRLVGNVRRANSQGEIEGARIVAAGSTADRLHGTFAAELLPFDSLSIRGQISAVNLTTAGFAFDSVTTNASWRQAGAELHAIVRHGEFERHEVELSLTRGADSTVIDLSRASFQFDSAAVWRLRQPTRLSISPRAVSVDSLLLDAGTGSVQLNGRLRRIVAGSPEASSANDRGPAFLRADSMQVGLYGLEVAHLMRLSQSGLDLTGKLSASAIVSGSLDAPIFRGSAGIVDGTLAANPLPEVHGTFDYNGDVLKAQAIASPALGEPFAHANAEIKLGPLGTGPKPAERTMTGTLTVEGLPLEVVPSVTANLSQLAGKLHGEVKLGGSLEHPDVNGALSITEGRARVDVIGVTLDRIEARVALEGDTLRIENFTAAAGGPVKVVGGLGLTNIAEPSFDLRLTANDAYVLANDRGRLRASNVDLTLTGPYTSATVNGSVNIRNGVIYLPDYTEKVVLPPWDSLFLVVLDTADARAQNLYVKPNPFVDNLDLSIQLSVMRDTWVRSSEANIELFSEGPLQITWGRALRELQLEGVLSTDRGQYTYFSKRFEIKRGSATFLAGQPELDPTLQITGEHEVQVPASGPVTISVVIRGTMLHPRISLESDAQPPMSQSDMIAYLASGRSTGSLIELGASGLVPTGGLSGVGKAGQSLVGVALGTLMSEIEREAEGKGMRSLGLDFLNITPVDTYSEIARGDVLTLLRQTEFEVGRYVTPRTFLAGQLRLSATPGIRAIHRSAKGYRFEMAWEPRLLLREPTLSEQPSVTKRAFSLFIIREWRF